MSVLRLVAAHDRAHTRIRLCGPRARRGEGERAPLSAPRTRHATHRSSSISGSPPERHPPKRWLRGELTLELVRGTAEVRLGWRGKSTDPDAVAFLDGVLAEAFGVARATALPLVLDFSALDHMNSATFTPVVRAIESARRLAVPVVLEYSLSRRWQALSFAALRTFETLDGSIQVNGK